MLGKSKKPKTDTPLTVANKEKTQSAPPPSRPAAPAPRGEKTTIGENILIEGQIKGEEHLVIDGQLKGKVELEKHNFTVGLNGRVDGQIRAQNVSISGQLMGTITALGKVAITKDADFMGDIKAKSIAVEDGAYFKGSIELDREPHRKSDLAPAPTGTSSPDAAKGAYPPPTDTHKES
jgi:cytoskeletal protein CcmA (bactofilin family)